MKDEGELKKRSMSLDYIIDIDKHLLLDGTEKYVEIGNIDEAKKDFPQSGAFGFNEDGSKIYDVYDWFKKWFGDIE